MNAMNIAIIGGGLTGLTAAIRAAQLGHHVDIYESAPELGGRTRSFFHAPTQSWIDNGPHLLIGAYASTLKLLHEASANEYVSWQASLCLPLWDEQRGYFALKTSPRLPFSLALMRAVQQLPQHGIKMLPSLLRMAVSLKTNSLKTNGLKKSGMKNNAFSGTVAEWMQAAKIHPNLQRDLLEVLCLGAMNEGMDTANAASFSDVLRRAFDKHQSARLGWFNQPLSQALIAPLVQYCKSLGVQIHPSSRVLKLKQIGQQTQLLTRHSEQLYDAIIFATAPSIRNQLLGIKHENEQAIETSPICNIHLWFEENITLVSPFIGGIGTYGQWFFDVSQQMHEQTKLSHICAVISADNNPKNHNEQLATVIKELQVMTGKHHLVPKYHRIITVQAATHVVRPHTPIELPQTWIDACEQPLPGELPATIESAVLRGEQAAHRLSSPS